MAGDDPQYVTRKEMAALLRCSVSHVKRLEKRGRLTPYRDGSRMVRYRRADAATALEAPEEANLS